MIREAQLGDARSIAELQVRVWHRNWAHFAQPVAVQGADIREQRWLGFLKDSGRHFVWELEGEIAGVVGTVPARDEDVDGGVGEIPVLMVDPPAQLNGIGSALHDHALAALRDGLFDRVVFWLFDGDEAGEEFLVARGWTPDGETGERHTLPRFRMARDL